MYLVTIFINVIKNVQKNVQSKENPQHLGRWKIESCNTKTNQKIDFSNEDHCGTCQSENDKTPFLLKKPFLYKN